jgi:hypothetical protein
MFQFAAADRIDTNWKEFSFILFPPPRRIEVQGNYFAINCVVEMSSQSLQAVYEYEGIPASGTSSNSWTQGRNINWT